MVYTVHKVPCFATVREDHFCTHLWSCSAKRFFPQLHLCYQDSPSNPTKSDTILNSILSEHLKFHNYLPFHVHCLVYQIFNNSRSKTFYSSRHCLRHTQNFFPIIFPKKCIFNSSMSALSSPKIL